MNTQTVSGETRDQRFQACPPTDCRTPVAEKGAFDPAFSDRIGKAGSIGARKIAVLQGYGFLPTFRHINVLQIPTRFPTIIFAKVREEEVLPLRLEALKYRGIAEQLGIGMSSVNTLLERALRKLQQATAQKPRKGANSRGLRLII